MFDERKSMSATRTVWMTLVVFVLHLDVINCCVSGFFSITNYDAVRRLDSEQVISFGVEQTELLCIDKCRSHGQCRTYTWQGYCESGPEYYESIGWTHHPCFEQTYNDNSGSCVGHPEQVALDWSLTGDDGFNSGSCTDSTHAHEVVLSCWAHVVVVL